MSKNSRRMQKNFNKTSALLGGIALTALLAACGGGGGGNATIGGTVTGLAAGRTLALQNNASDTFSITGNSGVNSFTFSFTNTVAAGGAYAVTVLTQPLGQTCTVANGNGNVDSNGNDVNAVKVTCTTTSSVVGTVTGVAAGSAVTLESNGVQVLSANGTFTFPGVLTAGSTYTVTIAQQPKDQTCQLANATGTVVANQSATVTVTCS